MHLISYEPKLNHFPFYPKRPLLTRPNTLPYLFYKLRHNHNLTKRALAEKFCLSEDYVSKIESGSKFPSLNYCLKCAKEFGINPKYIEVKWYIEAVERFSNRLRQRLGLDD